MAELNRRFIFNFLRNCQSVFWSDCTVLHCHQQCRSFSSSTSSPTLGIITASNWNHSNRCSDACPCGFNFHVTKDARHIFMRLYDTCVYSLVDYLFKSFASFNLIKSCCLIVEFWEFLLCSIYKSFIRWMFCKYLLLICVMSFHSLNGVFF